jgi:hypothetical protein
LALKQILSRRRRSAVSTTTDKLKRKLCGSLVAATLVDKLSSINAEFGTDRFWKLELVAYDNRFFCNEQQSAHHKWVFSVDKRIFSAPMGQRPE